MIKIVEEIDTDHTILAQQMLWFSEESKKLLRRNELTSHNKHQSSMGSSSARVAFSFFAR